MVLLDAGGIVWARGYVDAKIARAVPGVYSGARVSRAIYMLQMGCVRAIAIGLSIRQSWLLRVSARARACTQTTPLPLIMQPHLVQTLRKMALFVLVMLALHLAIRSSATWRQPPQQQQPDSAARSLASLATTTTSAAAAALLLSSSTSGGGVVSLRTPQLEAAFTRKQLLLLSLLLRANRVNSEQWLAELVALDEGLTWLQIGACDGKQDDPLYEHLLRAARRSPTAPITGVFVEPVYWNMDALQAHYKVMQEASPSARFTYVKAAINATCPDSGVVRFYANPPDRMGPKTQFLKGVGALDIGNRSPGVLTELNVSCLTPTELLLQHWRWAAVSGSDGGDTMTMKPDLLIIDTEGYDFLILRNLPLANQFRPQLIYFEDAMLKFGTTRAAQRYLLTHDYFPITYHGDVVALDMRPFAGLRL